MQEETTNHHESEYKTCSKCKIDKPVGEFNFKYRALAKRHSYCKECGSSSTRSHYRKNKSQYLERNYRALARHREFMRQAKSRPCADCGVQHPYYVMDFDHRDGATKSFVLSDITRATSKSLLKEIEKCDVVCANCHRERTQRRSLERRNNERAT